jgi:hypothetical protein
MPPEPQAQDAEAFANKLADTAASTLHIEKPTVKNVKSDPHDPHSGFDYQFTFKSPEEAAKFAGSLEAAKVKTGLSNSPGHNTFGINVDGNKVAIPAKQLSKLNADEQNKLGAEFAHSQSEPAPPNANKDPAWHRADMSAKEYRSAQKYNHRHPNAGLSHMKAEDVKKIQEAVGAEPDTKMGPETIKKFQALHDLKKKDGKLGEETLEAMKKDPVVGKVFKPQLST